MTDQLESYKEAKKTQEKARGLQIFVAHLFLFIAGNIFLGVWNVLTYMVKGNELLWFPMPLGFWGVGVLIHYTISVALFNDWWEHDETIIQTLV